MSDPAAAPPPPVRPAPTARRVIGIIIMLIGIAMTVVSGLCTAGFMVDDLSNGGGGGGEINLSGIEFVIGGPFILIGVLMWWGGARLKRIPVATGPDASVGPPPAPPPSN